MGDSVMGRMHDMEPRLSHGRGDARSATTGGEAAVDELCVLYDPDMNRDRRLGQIHPRASRVVLDGEIENEEIVQEMIADYIIERHRDGLLLPKHSGC